jgi:hypothetical protein
MQERQLFEYAVIRVVPRAEREEFINIGVIVYCSRQKFLASRIAFNEARLYALCPSIDIDQLKNNTRSFHTICAGGPQGGPIGSLPIAERFRWLTATRSTIVQTSKTHPGLCLDAEQKLNQLFSELVQ